MPLEIIHSFGDGPAEGNGETKDLLGGKGAGLAEMSSIGIPLAPGATTPVRRPDADHPQAQQVRLPLQDRRLGGSDEVHRAPRSLPPDVPACGLRLPLPAAAGGGGCDAGGGRGGDVVGPAWAEIRTLLVRTGIKRHGLPVPDAEDLANDTLVILIEKRDHIRKPGSVVPFAKQVLHRKVIDRHRRARRESIEDAKGADGEDLVSGLPAGGPSPEARAIVRQRVEAFLTAIERIRASRANAEHVLAIVRRVLVDGHRVCDVARDVKLSKGGVHLVVHRVRKLLRKAERAQERTNDRAGRPE